jgi:hypothetical protein
MEMMVGDMRALGGRFHELYHDENRSESCTRAGSKGTFSGETVDILRCAKRLRTGQASVMSKEAV